MVSYTTDDLKILAQCSSTEFANIIESFNYDPESLRQMMQGLPKDYNFLYEIPYEDLPEHIDDAKYAGYLNFRFKVGK